MHCWDLVDTLLGIIYEFGIGIVFYGLILGRSIVTFFAMTGSLQGRWTPWLHPMICSRERRLGRLNLICLPIEKLWSLFQLRRLAYDLWAIPLLILKIHLVSRWNMGSWSWPIKRTAVLHNIHSCLSFYLCVFQGPHCLRCNLLAFVRPAHLWAHSSEWCSIASFFVVDGSSFWYHSSKKLK